MKILKMFHVTLLAILFVLIMNQVCAADALSPLANTRGKFTGEKIAPRPNLMDKSMQYGLGVNFTVETFGKFRNLRPRAEAEREGYVAFKSLPVEVDARTFSMGVGAAPIVPAKDWSLSETLDYLEAHPNDYYMLQYLHSLITTAGQNVIDELIARFRIKPNLVIMGELALIRPGQYKGVGEALLDFANRDTKRYMFFMATHPNITIRAYADPDYYELQQALRFILDKNREEHVLIYELLSRRLSLPGQLLAAAQERDYTGVNSLSPGVYPKDVKRGTSIRKISPKETIAKIYGLEALSGVLLRKEMRGSRFNGTYATTVHWVLRAKVASGRNRYAITGKRTVSGKGMNEEDSESSGLHEMIERYSALAGTTKDFPSGYAEDKSMVFGSYEELTGRGLRALDPNLFSLSVSYENQRLYWVWGETIINGILEKILVPAQVVFIESNFDEPEVFYYGQSANGLGSGNEIPEARLHALLEVVERDGIHTTIYSPYKCFTIDAPPDTELGRVLTLAKENGANVQFLKLTTEFGIPAYKAFVKIGDQVISGSGAHLDPKIAIARALCELNPKLEALDLMFKSRGGLSAVVSRNLESAMVVKYDDDELRSRSTGSIKGDLKLVEDALRMSGFPIAYVDLTRKDLGIPVVRAIVPGLDMPDGVSERQILHLVEELERLGIIETQPRPSRPRPPYREVSSSI